MKLSEPVLDSFLAAARWKDRVFKAMAFGATFLAVAALAVFLVKALLDGVPRLDWKFLSSYPSRKPGQAGILSPLVGSLCLIVLTVGIAVPAGVGAAIYLEEYARRNWFSRLVEINLANLGGVPSIIYGLLGLEVFVRFLSLGRSLLAGALTMALLVLPVVIISAREALRAVPWSVREGAYALGATRWQAVWRHVLPLAFPGILTGIILAISRAIGETAPLVTIGALTYIAFLPDGLMSPFTALPIQIFNWISRPQRAFATNAAAGIVVLLVLLLGLNALAIWLRNRFQKKLHW